MKKLLVFLVFIAAMLVVAAYWMRPTSSAAGDVPYGFASVEHGSILEVVSATGQLAPQEITLVGSQLPGQVVKIHPNADFNRYVKKDEPLLVLDQSLAQIKLEQAKEAVELAKADVGRAQAQRDAAEVALNFQKGLAEGVQIKAKLDEAVLQRDAADAAVKAARVKVEMAESAMKEAQIGLEKTVVSAPASGIILERKVILGQMVGPQAPTPLFKIASDLSELEVHAQVAEADMSKVHVGLDAVFTVYAYSEGNDKFDGKVKQIHYLPTNVQGAVYYNVVISVANRRAPLSPEAKESWWKTQSAGFFAAAWPTPLGVLPWMQLKLNAEAEDWMLRPGMTATVDIIRRRHADVWKLPIEALNFQLEEYYQTSAAKAQLEKWQQRTDRANWKCVWILNAQKKPWPIFVRIGGTGLAGETGIKDGQFIEVLEWDPELEPKLDPKNPQTFPRVIISAPPVSKPSIFDKPNRMIS